MLSTLPNLANKAFILGFFLPTFLFVLALAWLFQGQPWAEAWLAAASEKDGWDSLAYFVVAVWGFSVLLMMINDLQLKTLEGYSWPVSKMPGLQRRETARFTQKKDRAEALQKQWQLEDEAFPDERKRELADLLMDLAREFPPDVGDHLPTRLGNAIRAFEVYSNKIYGADSIPLWLHLSTVISTDFQSTLDDARAQVNCAVNICFFAAVISLLALARLAWGCDWHVLAAAPDLNAVKAAFLTYANGINLLVAIVAAVICRLAYLFAIELVYPWGDLVKAAFDCYLPDLAKKMGFDLPETGDKRKEFWIAVSRQAIYWDALKPEEWLQPKDQPPDEQPGPMDEFARLVTSIMRDR